MGRLGVEKVWTDAKRGLVLVSQKIYTTLAFPAQHNCPRAPPLFGCFLMTQPPRIYLSPPHLGPQEREFVAQAFDTNWIAPLGPNVDGFEEEFCALTGAPHALALSSGTAGLHLAMVLEALQPGDEVFVSDLTFSASVNPIAYERATPVLIDSEPESWNMDPGLLEEALRDRAKKGKLPKALILVHLYGQSADIDPIVALCREYGVSLIEDAAEALGATYKGATPGTFGKLGIFSFNGNKIITTSGGGMLVSADKALLDHARKLSTQAREPAVHYEHREIGFNYRLSNLCAGVGRGQLQVLQERVAARRRNFDHYVELLGGLPGLEFAKEAGWGTHSRWLTCATVDPEAFGATRSEVIDALSAQNIEARPVWKPMHMQPVFAHCPVFGGSVGRRLFERGICLPSGSALTPGDRERIAQIVASCHTP